MINTNNLLTLDLGNSNITVGLYSKNKIKFFFRLKTEREKTEDEYGITILSLLKNNKIKPAQIQDLIMCSVVPPLDATFEKLSKKYFNKKLLVVGKNISVPVKNLYNNPEEVGTDRLVDALAAYNIFKDTTIVVDFGTATTYDVISKNGEYLGGAIVPGIGISLEALFQRAAKLPRIEIKNPGKIVGKNTVASMQAGVYFGFLLQAEGMIKKIKKEVKENCKVIATGGLAKLFFSEAKFIDKIVPTLTLDGLNLIYQQKSKLRGRKKEVSFRE